MPGYRILGPNINPILTGKKVPWQHNVESVYKKLPKELGPGELSTVATLLGIEVTDPSDPELLDLLKQFVSGQNGTFDITIPDSVRDLGFEWAQCGKFEVKEPGANGVIRTSDDGMHAVHQKFESFRNIANRICEAITGMEETLELYLPSEIFANLVSFAHNDIDMINTGTVSFGRALGHSTDQWVKQKFGMLQAAETLKKFKEARHPSAHREFTIQVSNGKQVVDTYSVDLDQYTAQQRATPFTISQVRKRLLNVGLTEFETDKALFLNFEAIDRPEIISQLWKELAIPSLTFRKVNWLILVSPTHVQAIPHAELDDRLSLFQLVLGGRPSYKTEFHYAPKPNESSITLSGA